MLLDSIATLNLNGDGIGINYHLGLFRQVFAQNKQTEQPDYWIQKESWLTKTEVQYPVQFGKLSVMSRMYDIDVTGYEGRVNKLHLFDIDTVDEKYRCTTALILIKMRLRRISRSFCTRTTATEPDSYCAFTSSILW